MREPMFERPVNPAIDRHPELSRRGIDEPDEDQPPTSRPDVVAVFDAAAEQWGWEPSPDMVQDLLDRTAGHASLQWIVDAIPAITEPVNVADLVILARQHRAAGP